jgi:hypothetical protein
MKNNNQNNLLFIPILIWLIGIHLVQPPRALAYTDPNTANFIFQLLFPIFAVIGMGFLMFKNFIRRKFKSLKDSFKNKSADNKSEEGGHSDQ